MWHCILLLTDTNVSQESPDSTIRVKQNTVQMWWVIWAGYNKGTSEMARTNYAAPIDPIHFDPKN
jgi:hypothetical protein